MIVLLIWNSIHTVVGDKRLGDSAKCAMIKD